MILQTIISLLCSQFAACQPAPCYDKTVATTPYTICTFDLKRVDIQLMLNSPSGNAFGSVGAARRHLVKNGKSVKMVMNAGMYHEDLSPVGLYVEGGKQLKSISTKSGPGNFHLLPNGVFFLNKSSAGVYKTSSYLDKNINPDFATQSGPMLVIEGKLHRRFLKNSDSLKIRNGVGVSADGQKVSFAISRKRVNFWNFGVLFRDHLKTPNALFLDGSISTFEAPHSSRWTFYSIGPIVAVTDR